MKKIIVLLGLTFFTVSCVKIITTFHLITNDKAQIGKYTNGKKSLLFIGATHIGKPRYFASVKAKIDSLRQNGYAVFYEGIGIDYKKNDSVAIELYLRKFKKVTGIYLLDYGHKNKTIRIPKIKGMVSQTASNTGIDSKIDNRADFDLVDLVKKYESIKGEIILTECDLKADLYDLYKCEKIDKLNSYYMITALREEVLVEKINESKAGKIVVLYGAAHEWDTYKRLKKIDSNWVYSYPENIKSLRQKRKK